MTTVRQRKIVQLGASKGLTLPADLCAAHGFAVGSMVEVHETKEGLLLRAVLGKPVLSLAERIARSDVDAVRSAGQALRDEPAAGREA